LGVAADEGGLLLLLVGHFCGCGWYWRGCWDIDSIDCFG
jgi:hypothetical protein